jgi:hypothetical protein
MSVTWLMYFLWFASGFAVITAMAKTMSIRHPLLAARGGDEEH